MQTVTQELLGQLASQQIAKPDTINGLNDAGNANTTENNGFDWLDQWVAEFAPELAIQFQQHPEGGRLAHTECPLDPSHGRDASVRQFPSGAIVAGCYHDSCSLKNWHGYRAAKEAEYAANPASTPSNNAQPFSANWQPPTPLEHVVQPEPPALDALLIPDELRDNCEDIAYRLQAPIEYALICLIIMFATLIGHKLVIYAKRFDSWLESPNIWGLIIGPPSAMKSPVIREVMGRLIKLDKRLYDAYLKKKGDYDAEISILDNDIKDLLNQQKKKSTDLTIKSQISAKRQELKDKKASPPLMQRLVLQDVTIEKAQEILSETGAAALILWDEISSFFKIINKAGREGDRGFYLASWNGTDPSITDRIGRGTVIIDRLGLSLLGGIQPDVLRRFINQAMDQFGNDGFLQRFQLILFPPFNKAEAWQYTDKTPDQISNQFLDEAIEILYDWIPEKDVNAALYRCDKAGFVGVQFDDDAQPMFKEWLTKLQRSLRDGSIDSNIEIEHYAKYSALMLKLALTFHVIKHIASRSIPAKVDLITTARAIAWTEYLALHAERLTGKSYIGQTIKPVKKRFKEHCNPKNNSLISKAIRVHGGAIFMTLYEASSKEELNRVELDAIRRFNTEYPNGYNLVAGPGSDVAIPEEVNPKKKKQSDGRTNNSHLPPIHIKTVGNIMFMTQAIKEKNTYLKHVDPSVMKGKLRHGIRSL